MTRPPLDAEQVRQAWRDAHLVPLWESPTAHKQPRGPEPAIHWPWQELRPLLDYALDVTDPAAVERRVLQLINPRARDAEDEFTVNFMAAALQVLKPGESARPHRHSMNALRFVLEGEGMVTIVDGKECAMEYGDLILTPAWCWHEHRHDGGSPMIWLDVLDVPLHRYLGTAEFEPGPISDEPETYPDAAFAAPNVVPELAAKTWRHSPIFRYPYHDSVTALRAAPRGPDRLRRVRYVNPMTGGAAMSILDSHMIELDADFSIPHRTSASAVCAVAAGRGETRIGEQTIEWEQKDIFTLPQGNWVSHRAVSDEARLFAVSDRVALECLGLLQDAYGEA